MKNSPAGPCGPVGSADSFRPCPQRTWAKAKALLREQSMTMEKVAERFGVARSPLYRNLKRGRGSLTNSQD